MNTKSNLRKKAVSPLIATILLIVVAVILVTVLLTWGKFFTSSSLDSANQGLSLTRSDAELYIYPKSLTNGLLQFNYSPQSNFGEIVIESYKVLSDSGETPDTNLASAYTLKQGTNVISLTDFSKLGLDSSLKVTIVLQTTDNHYISVKNITNVFTEAPVDLPYVMFGTRKLYIQPDQNTTRALWTTAGAYCDNLDAHGYDDWYLPSATQLRAIWDTYTYLAGDSCLDSDGYITTACINSTILATNTNFVSLVGD
jgi:flagellin-like protein